MVRSERSQTGGKPFSALVDGMGQLLRARMYAQAADIDIWQFALNADELRDAGFSTSELRFLIHNSYVENAMEITVPGDECRTFRGIGRLSQILRTCYVLTEAGEQFAGEVLNGPVSKTNGLHTPSTNGDSVQASSNGKSHDRIPIDMPTWDANRKELRLGDQLVKIFKWPACNQELVLAVFEEEGWPARIDDPLPMADGQDPKRRLHDTIKCLNRSQKRSLIRFRGDGTGEGVIWELIVNASNGRETVSRH